MSTSSASLPALFVSHGSPMFAVEGGTTAPALHTWAQQLAAGHKLNGVLVMSPHWMTRGAPQLTSGERPATWHDFGGFPPELYELDYPAPGEPALATMAQRLLAQADLPVGLDAKRPFDHGAWVPLMHLFPAANVPAVQLSLPAGFSARDIHAIGQALSPLRDEGILLMGTGSLTHNLGEFFNGPPTSTPPYINDFARWVEQAVMSGDERLFDFARHAPSAARAHPTDEHFLPIFFALGAGGWRPGHVPPIDWLSRETMYHVLAMDAFAIG